MVSTSQNGQKQLTGIKYAPGEQSLFQPVQHVRVAKRYPAGPLWITTVFAWQERRCQGRDRACCG